MKTFRALTWLTVLAALATAPLGASAQGGLVAPELETRVEPELAEALAPGERVQVVLTILIGVGGEVQEAEIFESGGEAVDAAALAAARQLVFVPATRDGVPIQARIRFAFTLQGPELPAEEPEPPPPTTGLFQGRVSDLDEGPIEGARILLDAVDGSSSTEVVSDPTGAFSLEIDQGDYLVAVVADGYADVEAQETITAGSALEVTYRLSAEEGDDAEPGEVELGVTAVVDRPRREATRRTLSSEVLNRIPGTRGDALRVIELLPGVARPPFGSGQIVIRGAAPGDSEVFLNGVSVPLLYHFGGLTSFFQSRLIERIDFFPGNFSVRYGRRIGGVIEVEPRDPSTDDFHGLLDINLIDSSLMLEIPLWENAGIALAARRSYVDLFFTEVIPEGVFNVIAAPVYYDYQLVFAWRPTRGDRLRLFVYGSSDEFNTTFDNQDFARPFQLELSTQFHRAQVEWRHEYDDVFQQDISFAGGWTGLVIQAGQGFGLDAEFVPLTMRAEWRLEVHEQVNVRWGMDWTYTPTQLAFRSSATPRQSEGQPASGRSGARSEAAYQVQAYRPAVYVESSLSPIEPVTLTVGLRLDYYRDIGDWSFDPRATVRWQIDEQWTLKAGLGLFSQPPEFQETAPGLGNPMLDPITAVHASGGVELRWDRTWRFDLEVYYKHIFDRVAGTAGGVPPFFLNNGVGRIYGAELSARIEPTPGFPLIGFLSYTLSRSERLDPGGEWRLFDFDQTHILSTALVWRIGDGWEVGGTFRLISGNPYTAVTGSVYDVGADNYLPVYGAVNGERNPFFTRLDLRLEKTFEIDIVTLALYIDVQNVYNAENREAITYSYDYRRSMDVIGLPILPSIGIRGSM